MSITSRHWTQSFILPSYNSLMTFDCVVFCQVSSRASNIARQSSCTSCCCHAACIDNRADPLTHSVFSFLTLSRFSGLHLILVSPWDLTLRQYPSQCPRALLPVSYLQFHCITYPLVLVLFVSRSRKFGTPYLLKFVNVKPWLPSNVT